jgi:alpha-glucoside transport system permease protein
VNAAVFLRRFPLHFFMVAAGLLWIVPTLGLLVTSLRPVSEFTVSGWWTVFGGHAQIGLQNYSALFKDNLLAQGFVNSVLIAIPGTVIPIGAACLAAYASTFIAFRGRDVLFLAVVALMVVPLQMALIPVSYLYGFLHLQGIPGIVLMHAAFAIPYATFLFRNFFSALPSELLESAHVDGAGEWRIFRSIVLPLSLPAIASFAVFQFLWVWNDLLVALVFSGPSSKPVTVAILEHTRFFGSSVDVIAASSFLSMLPPLVLFFAFQRYFVQGLLAGSVKG